MGGVRECGGVESSGNRKTGPNTFSVVQDRQKTKHATFEFIEPGLLRKDDRLYARAVSYTHLDVYKRQHQDHGGEDIPQS